MSAPAIDRYATGTPNPTAKARSGKKGAGAEAGDEPAAKKSFLKSKKMIIAVVALLGIGGGAYKMLMPTKVGPPVAGDTVTLDDLTLNLSGGHYLKIGIAIELVQGKASATSFDSSKAVNAIIDEFSGRSVAVLSSDSGRNRLMSELTSKVKAAYPGEVFGLLKHDFVTD